MSKERNGSKIMKFHDNMPRKKLEIGKHGFKDRILRNCIYVDKTQYIYDLISNESNCFLSRPRRFGKSLLLSTLKEIFSGSKELFKDCWIYDKIEWKEYPIIHIDFLNVDFMTVGLEQAIHNTLDILAEKWNIQLKRTTVKEKFGELIEYLSKDEPVVILIDEYDKPIIDYIDDMGEAKKNRDILKNFYSTLKTLSNNINFLLITGVSKFTKVSIFSDLNHLKDITLHPRYSRMLGYTQEEIEYYFSPYIEEWKSQSGKTREELFIDLKDYYDGYSWDGINFVYNPFSILNFFDIYVFKNYWFISGSPTFLVNKLKHAPVFIDKYECFEADEDFFETFDFETINIPVLLFQTGYLTIKAVEGKKYTLSYPNREVRESFLKNLLKGFSNKPQEEITAETEKIKKALEENNLALLMQSLKVLLSSIPYSIQVDRKEAYYHSLIYLALKLSMVDIQCETQTSTGRSDIVVFTHNYIYIIEFKMSNAHDALNQIEEKQYYYPYLIKNKEIVLLGIALDSSQRNVTEWKTRKIDPIGTNLICDIIKQERKIYGEPIQKDNTEANRMAEKREMAKQMLLDGLPIKLITKYSGLTVEEIEKL